MAPVRRLAGKLPQPLKSGLRGVLRRNRAAADPRSEPAERPPQLSVVVTVTVPGLLDHCLASLQAQTLTGVEILVVDQPHVTVDDPRIRFRAPSGAGVLADRNAAAAEARGTYLAFLDSADTVPAGAYASLVGSLERTGSDFAAGAFQQVRQGIARRPAWVAGTHELDRPAVDLAGFPLALQDACATNRVFRTEFWRQLGGFSEGSDRAEAYAVVAATLHARRFDFLQTLTCQRHAPADPAALAAEPPDDVADHLHWLRATWELVREHADDALAGAWLGRLIDGDLGDLAAAAQHFDETERDRLQVAAAECLAAADDWAWPMVRVDRKLRLGLAARGAWTDLELLIEQFRLFGAIPQTEVRDGRVYAVAATIPQAAAAPSEQLELSASQTAFSGCLERIRWHGARLEVDGWACVRGVDLGDDWPELTAELVEETGERRLPAEVRLRVEPAANEWTKFRYQDVARGGFTIALDTSRIEHEPGRWQLRLTVTARGVTRSGSLTSVLAGGPGRRLLARPLAGPDDAFRVVPQLDPQLGFSLQVRAERVRAASLAVTGWTATGALARLDATIGALAAVRATSGKQKVEAALAVPDEAGGQTFALDLPAGSAVWEVRAIDGRGREHRISWQVEAVAGDQVAHLAAGASWHRSPRGFAELRTGRRGAEVTGLSLDAQRLTVHVRHAVPLDDLGRSRLVGALAAVDALSCRALTEDEAELAFPLRASRWGGPELPLPGGDYQVTLPDGSPLQVADSLLAELPIRGLSAAHRYVVGRTNGGGLQLTLAGPRSDDEVSRVGQHRLGQAYGAAAYEARHAVLFQCYRGEFATDSQLAIHRELMARPDPPDLIWGVSDLSVPVPAGGRALLIESREWYDALGSSRWLCRNIDVERYFVKRGHQRYLQTFHGYPFKSMGASLWRAQGRAESVIEREKVRRSSAWDAILVPAEFCVEFYRSEYGFTGEALVTGYPRDDDIVTGDPAAARRRVLGLLGIPETSTVVLYAPTWRDSNATSAWTATFYDALDTEQLAARLGPDYAILLRGHNYNLREGIATSAGVYDVSSYPEINDLILAADVAVLDYSSLRFDWLLTGKPVLFFVPDLADYLSSRTVLFDFAPTAPGPLLGTTDEVAAALLGLGAVAAEYAAARESFNQRFNGLHDGQATKRVVDAFFS